MRTTDILLMCLRNLFKRKLRTVLTMLGVVLGTSSIIVLVSLGLANNLRFEQQIATMGDVNVITVHNPRNMWWSGMDDQQMETPNLDSDASRSFSQIPGVGVVSPMLRGELFFRSGNYAIAWGGQVIGIDPESMADFGYEIFEGRLLQDGDNLEVVFGYNAERNFLNTTSQSWSNERFWLSMIGEEVETYVDIWNDRITMSYDSSFIFGAETQDQDIAFGDIDAPRPIRPVAIQVVGRLARSEGDDWTTDGGIFMNIETVRRLNNDARRHTQENNMWGVDVDYGTSFINARTGVVQDDAGYDMILVRVSNLDDVSQVRQEIESRGFPAHSPTQWLEGIQGMAESQQQMLAAIGVVSLLVAAIGIANTMVMSTYERTREIGVMKVIGAALSDIKKLFLIEAALIGLFGGLIGVLFSYLVSYLLNTHTNMEFMGGMFDWIGEPGTVVSLIPTWLGGLALLFSSLIGLISGYFPARRAMRLSALNAIRTE
ncbi:MAG: ABC transporter permease [Defluviitaleaceae bacterium]|nr:ABC transporter permease [Defluviitaleaceae bacterium]